MIYHYDTILQKVADGFPIEAQFALQDINGNLTILADFSLWSMLKFINGEIPFKGIKVNDMEDFGIIESTIFEINIVKPSEIAKFHKNNSTRIIR